MIEQKASLKSTQGAFQAGHSGHQQEVDGRGAAVEMQNGPSEPPTTSRENEVRFTRKSLLINTNWTGFARTACLAFFHYFVRLYDLCDEDAIYYVFARAMVKSTR